MNESVIKGIQLILLLLEGAANATVAVTKLNAAITAARAEGRDITPAELAAAAEINNEKLDEVLALLGFPRVE
jgi:hypothetical protein